VADNNKELKNLPKYEQLKIALKSYLAIDKARLGAIIIAAYKSIGQIETLPMRFVTSFIDQQASLFSGKIARQISGQEDIIDLDVLTDAESEAESYFHLFKKAAMFVYFDKDKDEDDNEISFQALDSTVYFNAYKQNKSWYYQKEDLVTVRYTENEDKSISVYKKTGKTLESVLTGDGSDIVFHDSEQWLDAGIEVDVMPFVEWSYKRIETAVYNDLVDLEQNYIKVVSWGIYNLEPKLLSQIAVESGMSKEELKGVLTDLGRTTKALNLGLNDKLLYVDLGDAKVLEQALTSYEKLLTQRALSLGVDKNAVIPSAKVESGTAKMIELEYINEKRNKYKLGAKIFEKEIMKIVEKMTEKSFNYGGIVFFDKTVAPTKEEVRVYADAMKGSKYWSDIQAYAFVHQLDEVQAKKKMLEHGLLNDDLNKDDDENINEE